MQVPIELRMDYDLDDGATLGIRFVPAGYSAGLSAIQELINSYDWEDEFRLKNPRCIQYRDPAYVEIYLNPGHFVTLFHEAIHKDFTSLSILVSAHHYIQENFASAPAWSAACKDYYERTRR